jgi:hypothetical protein
MVYCEEEFYLEVLPSAVTGYAVDSELQDIWTSPIFCILKIREHNMIE